MNKIRNSYWIILLAIIISSLCSASDSFALGLDDAKVRGSIALTSQPNDGVLSYDDRWLFVAGQNGLDIIDTATFEVTQTLSTCSGEVISAAFDSYQFYLFVLCSDGKLAAIDLEPLLTAYPGQAVEFDTAKSIDVSELVPDIIPVAIAAGPYPGTSADEYVFVADGQNKNVLAFSETDILEEASTIIWKSADLDGKPRGLEFVVDRRSDADRVLLVAVDGAASKIQMFGSTNAAPKNFIFYDQLMPADADAADTVRGIAASLDGKKVGVGNESKSFLHLIDINEGASSTLQLDNHSPSMTYFTGGKPTDMDFFEYSTGFFFVTTDDKKLYIVDAESGDNTFISIGIDPNFVDVSSAYDAYFYVGGSNSTAGEVQVVTLNPWIDILSITPDISDGSQSTTVTFKSDENGTLVVRKGGNIYGQGGSSVPITDPDVVKNTEKSFQISKALLNEGINTFYMFVENNDGFYGRLGFIVNKDTSPRPPEFKLDFGNLSMIVTIHALADTDIQKYIIYYSADQADLDESALSTDANQVSAANFTPGKKFETEINNLKNGQRYYVRVRAFDIKYAGKLSEIKSIAIQKTVSYSESKGESGSCRSTVAANTGNAGLIDTAFLFALWTAGLVFIRRRTLKSRSFE